MSGEVKNFIYDIKFSGCGEEYIGESGNSLHERVTVQNQQIRDPQTRMLKVSEHKDNCAKTIYPKYTFFSVL